VRALGARVDEDQFGGEADRPAAVLALGEAENLAARDDRVLDDPVQRAADHLLVPLWQVARGHQRLGPGFDPAAEVVEVAGAVGDLGHAERHGAR
jgi:hypothetical protein